MLFKKILACSLSSLIIFTSVGLKPSFAASDEDLTVETSTTESVVSVLDSEPKTYKPGDKVTLGQISLVEKFDEQPISKTVKY